jgi:hypothetical protein
MPEPQINNYRKFYRVTDLFIRDYKISVASVAYVDAVKVLDIVYRHDRIVNTAALNEIVRIIGSFPYKYVNAIMQNFKEDEVMRLYFEEMPQDFDPGF